MTLTLRDDSLHKLGANIITPSYDRTALTPGIIHIGVGNFHRAHQAVYLDKLFGMGVDLDWAVIGAGVRSEDATMRDKLRAQNYLSSVSEVDNESCATRVCGAMIDFVEVNSRALIDALTKPEIKIVSLTITEGGYFLEEDTGGFDCDHADIVRDSNDTDNPKTVFGVLVAAIKQRRRAGVAPFTVMSCDNLPGNGRVARQAVTGLAGLIDAELRDWIDANISFPNGMVDRITPATGARERALAGRQLGAEDAAPVVCETFHQWILEDAFPGGRPALQRVGVQFVDDVVPYELMKLRIVNGSHACIAYAAALLGVEYVHDAMNNELVRAFLDKVQSDEIIPTVRPAAGVDIVDYFELTKRRFANKGIADTVARLCMDGSNRQPKFIFPTIAERIKNSLPVDGLALEVALWCRYCAAEDDAGKPIKVDDINADRLREFALRTKNEPMIFLTMTDIFGAIDELQLFKERFAVMLNSLWKNGVAATLQNYLNHKQQ